MLTERDNLTDNRFWFGHTEPDNVPLIREKAESEGPLILAMRHPVDVAKSWIKRSKTLDDTFKSMWRTLFGLKAEILDSFWLPVDVDDRDEYLKAIEKRVGLSLVNDFTPRGVFAAQNYEYSSGMTVEEATEWLKNLPFEAFGYRL